MIDERRERSLRIRIANALWRLAPRAGAESIQRAVEDVMRAVTAESSAFGEHDVVLGCACWDCVLSLNADVVQSRALLDAEMAAADDVD